MQWTKEELNYLKETFEEMKEHFMFDEFEDITFIEMSPIDTKIIKHDDLFFAEEWLCAKYYNEYRAEQ